MERRATVSHVPRSAWALGLLCFGFATGCSPGTEVVVAIDSDELIAPTDVQRVRITVTNPAKGTTPIYQSQDLAVCPPGRSANCFAFPISLTLVPGRGSPEDAVRVEVDAFTEGGQLATSDASVFTFAPGQSQRLEFFLYRSCLAKQCAANDKACDSSGDCITVQPVSPGGGDGQPGDLASPPDLASLLDLASLPDLASPPDLACSHTPNPKLFGEDKAPLNSTDTHSSPDFFADASNFIAPAAGTVSTLSVYYSGDVDQILIGLYDNVVDNNNVDHPHKLLAMGTVDKPTTDSWITACIPSVAIQQGAVYWIAMVAPLGSGTFFAFPYSTGNPSSITTEHSVETGMLTPIWNTGQTFPTTRCAYYASP